MITYPLTEYNFILEHTYQAEHVNFTYNATKNHRLYYWVVKNDTNAVINDIRIYDMVIYNYDISDTPYTKLSLQNQLLMESYYQMPYTTTWFFTVDVFADYVAEDNPINMTLYIQMRYIE